MDSTKTREAGKGEAGVQDAPSGPVALPEPSAEELRAQQETLDERASQTEAVRAAAELGAREKKGKLSPEAQASALDWFLSDEELPMEYTLDVDIGSPGSKRIVSWTITAISSDTLKSIRTAAAEGNRGRRRAAARAGEAPELDEQEMNARILVAGSTEPDLVQVAKDRGAPEHPDPAVPAVQLLRHRLRHKPGLIDQLAGEVLRLSGYDDEDIREHEAGKA